MPIEIVYLILFTVIFFLLLSHSRDQYRKGYQGGYNQAWEDLQQGSFLVIKVPQGEDIDHFVQSRVEKHFRQGAKYFILKYEEQMRRIIVYIPIQNNS